MDDLIVDNKSIRVLIIDDQPLVRFGVRSLLGGDPAITVVGDTAYGDELSEILAEAQPDVVVLDPGCGQMQQRLASLRRMMPEGLVCRIIVYSAEDDKTHILQATVERVNGYLTKDCSTDELLRAIHAVHEGGTTLSPNVAATLVQIFNEDSYEEPPETQMLSNRELEVLSCLAEGRSNRSIATKLFICEATVKFHVHAILGKLNVKNRTEAVLAAAQRGLVTLSPS